jgi:cardiolipin synthase
MELAVAFVILHFVIVTACIGRILLRRHRQPESRVAWLVVVLTLPYLGVVAYLMLGETSIGRARVARLKRAFESLPRPESAVGWSARENESSVPERYEPLFRVGESISGYPAVGGNQARLMKDPDTVISEMVADIDGATDHVI